MLCLLLLERLYSLIILDVSSLYLAVKGSRGNGLTCLMPFLNGIAYDNLDLR